MEDSLNSDSENPILFNFNVDEIIEKVRNLKGYRLDERNITTRYTNDAVLIVENEDDFQRLLYKFNLSIESFNMVISASTIKCTYKLYNNI